MNKPTLSRRQFLQAAGVLAGAAALPRWLTRRAAPYQVAIAQATTYDRDTIRAAVADMLDQLGGLSDLVRPGDKIAIKPNLTGGSIDGLPFKATDVYLTHPEVVGALCAALRDAGAGDLYLVEGIWDSHSWSNFGYEDIAREFNAELIDLNSKHPYEDYVDAPVSGGAIYDSFQLNGILSDVDRFMSVPKMKCHSSCGVTLSLKNLVGIVPISVYQAKEEDGRRSELHGTGQEFKTRLPRVVVDLNLVRPIDFALIDGIKTSQAGEGPWVPGFSPIAAHVLVAGKNPVATDAVAAAVMGFDPEGASQTDTPFTFCDNHLQLAAAAGLGSNRLDDIDILGASLDDVRVSFRTSTEMG